MTIKFCNPSAFIEKSFLIHVYATLLRRGKNTIAYMYTSTSILNFIQTALFIAYI